jgi:hypothetical protein
MVGRYAGGGQCGTWSAAWQPIGVLDVYQPFAAVTQLQVDMD